MRRDDENRYLTHGPVMKTMLRFAVPMILGNLMQQCYNIADTLIVGAVPRRRRAGRRRLGVLP